MSLSDEVIKWAEMTNPFLYLSDLEAGKPLCALKELKVFKETEILIMRGVDSFEYEEALDRGLKVLLVEDDQEKIFSFLKQMKPHENLFVATSDKEQIFPIIKKFVFKKIQYEGDLTEISSYIDGMQMSYSEYRDLGETILPNIVSNLLHIEEFVDGRKLDGILKGEEALVCGNGISLPHAIEKILKMKARPFIFSCGSSLPVLLKSGIIPDFYVMIDPAPPVEIYECLKEVSLPVFYQNRASRDLLFMHKGPKIFMGSGRGWQIEESLMNEIGRTSFFFDPGCNAGTFGAHIAMSMGCSKIVLAGMDGVAKAGESTELVKDGKVTRSDLFYGMEFLKELKAAFPDQRIEHYTEGFVFDETAVVSEIDVAPKSGLCFIPEGEKIEASDVKEVLDRYFDHEMMKALEKLFAEKDEIIQRAKAACLMAEFSLQPLFMNFLQPMWGVWKDLIPESMDNLAELTFYYNVLKVFEGQSGFSGEDFYLFGKKEGLLKRFDKNKVLREEGYYFRGLLQGTMKRYNEKGDLILSQEFDDGRFHGEYKVYREGSLIREGQFVKGKAHGKHFCYSDGRMIDQIEFDQGRKCGVHKIYSEKGQKIEELIYHDESLFDRFCFDAEGSKTYEGVWIGKSFTERGFESNNMIWEREGKLIDGKCVFKEEF